MQILNTQSANFYGNGWGTGNCSGKHGFWIVLNYDLSRYRPMPTHIGTCTVSDTTVLPTLKTNPFWFEIVFFFFQPLQRLQIYHTLRKTCAAVSGGVLKPFSTRGVEHLGGCNVGNPVWEAGNKYIGDFFPPNLKTKELRQEAFPLKTKLGPLKKIRLSPRWTQEWELLRIKGRLFDEQKERDKNLTCFACGNMFVYMFFCFCVFCLCFWDDVMLRSLWSNTSYEGCRTQWR